MIHLSSCAAAALKLMRASCAGAGGAVTVETSSTDGGKTVYLLGSRPGSKSGEDAGPVGAESLRGLAAVVGWDGPRLGHAALIKGDRLAIGQTVKHHLCLAFALPSWLRHHLCLAFALPSWLRPRLSLRFSSGAAVGVLKRDGHYSVDRDGCVRPVTPGRRGDRPGDG